MSNFCSNCGKELKPEQDVCLNCGVVISKTKEKKELKSDDHSTYKLVTGIIMIILGICILCVDVDIAYVGLFGLLAGIFNLGSRKNEEFLILSAITMFISAFLNCIIIEDISVFAILSVVFGIFNIIYFKK